jgi:hypothetical protein
MTPLQRREQSGLSPIFDFTGDELPQVDLGPAFTSIQDSARLGRRLDLLAGEIEEIGREEGK